MGLFNWFSWCWPNAALRAECFNLRRELGATEHLLHEAQRGAELMVQTNEFLNAELKKCRYKCKKLEAENETLAAENDRVWHELNRLTDDVNECKRAAEQPKTATGVTIETSETELEQKAWQLWLRGDDSIEGVWRKAELWLRARQSKRNGQEKLTDEQ